jgi:hypothetical protein
VHSHRPVRQSYRLTSIRFVRHRLAPGREGWDMLAIRQATLEARPG